MTKAQLKLDKKLQTDKDGMSSDEVLYDISQRKLSHGSFTNINKRSIC